MKVLLATDYFPPHWTGIAKAFYHLGKNLQKQGHTVEVLTTKFDSSHKSRELLAGLHITRVGYAMQLSRTHLSPQTVVRALTMIGKFDAVVINSPHSNVLPLAILARLFGTRLYIFHQGDLTLPRQTGNQIANRVLERVFDAATIPALALAHRVSCSTRDYAQHSRVMKYFLHKFFAYIPDLALSNNNPRASFKKKIDSLKRHHVLIGIAGRFVEEKGFDILLRAMPKILKHVPHAHIVFAGAKRMEYEPFFDKHKTLIQKHKQNVTFLGLLEAPDLTYFYKKLDVFIISSRSDCFPLTQIEAALAGVPIVCTDIPGARMLVRETGAGKIVSVKDTALASGTAEVMKDNDKFSNRQNQVRKFLKRYEAFTL